MDAQNPKTARQDKSLALPDLRDERSARMSREGERLAFPVPTTALELGALLRHVEIDGEFADWTAAAAHMAEASGHWKQIESMLASRLRARKYVRGAKIAAGELAGLLARAGDAVRHAEAKEVVRLARRAIVLVDVVQRVFE